MWGGRAEGAGGGARTSTHEGHDSSPNQPLKRALDPPRPDLRTLEVAQQRNGPARRLRRLPYVGSRLPMGVRVAMREIEPGDVHAGQDHRPQHLGR